VAPADEPLVETDVVIIGAGAAGLMCAIEAGKRGRSVLLIDHMDRIGRKIRISGGGRCNFTNLVLRPENYISSNPHFCKSAIARFSPRDFISMVEMHGIDYFEKEEGQLFCRRASAEIVNMLHDECKRVGVGIRLNCRIENISKAGRFCISTNGGIIQSASLVVASGGLSYPNLGATDIGYRIAEQFDLKVTGLKPALVPLVFTSKEMEYYKELSGISFGASIRFERKRFRGEVLFTHRGLSGPATLQVSSYWKRGKELAIDLLPEIDAFELLISKHRSQVSLGNLLSEYLPRRFAHKWSELNVSSKPLCTYSEKELRSVASKLHNWTITPAGTEGYNKAEITLGGIDTNELSSKTMESKRVPGLFFAGEVIDVSGQLGGYNLQWAWSSGFAAGQYA
jgi:predicted Rossmann fold flavoprotein